MESEWNHLDLLTWSAPVIPEETIHQVLYSSKPDSGGQKKFDAAWGTKGDDEDE